MNGLTTNFYNNLDKQYEVSATYQTNSNGSTLKKWFKYPKDMAVAPYTSMVDRNMLSQVIVTTDSIDNRFLQENETLYSSWSSPFSNPLIAPSGTTVRRGTGAKETEYTYHNYDIYGNLQYASKYGADPVVYLWSYNYQYPIAEIKNASFDQVQTNLGGYSVVNQIAAANEPSSSDLTTINNLRTQLPYALVTTYTYKPLVGKLSMTDPRGVITKYDYDSFGRLIKVTQADKVIETYDYHYKN